MTKEERIVRIKELIEMLDHALVLAKELNALLDEREKAMEKLVLEKLKERQETSY